MAGLPQAPGLRETLLDLLFPRWCLGCGKGGSFICNRCSEMLPYITAPICFRCGLPQPEPTLCPACYGKEFATDGIRSVFRFDGLVRQAVYGFKYRNLRAISRTLAGLMNDYITANPMSGDILISVPLHPKRLRERGYNQSALLAEELGRLTGLPVDSHSLHRTHHTPPQARTTTVEERRANTQGIFSCDSSLGGQRIILIDDVTTSGATLESCAGALKAAGAASVWGLTLAREV